MATFLLELLSEEIPATMQKSAAEQLKDAWKKALTEHHIAYETIAIYATPRRLACLIEGLPLVQDETITERKGPRVDAPQAALDGFLKSVGLTKDQLTIQPSAKGNVYIATVRQQGQAVSALLAGMAEGIIQSFRWPKSMRWSAHTMRWVRPLHRIVCLFNQQVLPIRVEHLEAGNVTQGHRFMAKNRLLTIRDPKDYLTTLTEHQVIACPSERERSILEQVQTLIRPLHLQLRPDARLLEEIVGLVEFPAVLLGKFDERFMVLPQEALVSVMRTHQKYLTVQDASGALAPYFIAVSNICAEDQGKSITEGFERVLTARLTDARFFWDKDRKSSLESRVLRLKQVVFHAKLGTVEEKARRMEALAKMLSPLIPEANTLHAERAALLAKTDLVTEMVGEFPELQGIMGYYYSLADHEPAEVAIAIRDHYLPQGPNDSLPQSATGVVVALADKIDTLAGLFAAGEIPTGSKDPFALRRAALGIIRMILQHELHLPLRTLFRHALSLYPSTFVSKDQPVEEVILNFLEERLRVLLREEHIPHDLIQAVFDGGAEDDFTRLKMRVLALTEFLATPQGEALLGAYRRAGNIVLAEEKKDGILYTGNPEEAFLEQKEEVILYNSFKTLLPVLEKALKHNDFKSMMQELAGLHAPINAFFDHVTVNTDQLLLRKNRLLLLSTFRDMLHHVANFKLISG